MPHVIWTGDIEGQVFRVIDLGSSISPRLQVEIRQGNDLLGAEKWGLFDPIPTGVFSRMLLDSGVVT